MAKQQKEKGKQQKNKKHLAIFWRRRSRRKKIDKNRNATQEHVGFLAENYLYAFMSIELI